MRRLLFRSLVFFCFFFNVSSIVSSTNFLFLNITQISSSFLYNHRSIAPCHLRTIQKQKNGLVPWYKIGVHLRYLTYIAMFKGPLSWYRKLTWKSAHAWNLIILCTFIAWGMTTINMVHLIFYAIPLLIYDVMDDITTRSKDTLL